MRLTVLAAAAMGSVVVLVGFAGAANASATVDLIWIDKSDPACLDAARRDCPQLGTSISSVAVSDNITLAVILTAGPNGSRAAGVSVNYGNALPRLSVVNFRQFITEPYLTFSLADPINQSPYIDHISAASLPAAEFGIGLPPGVSAYLGTVSFHEDLLVYHGVLEIAVGTDGPRGGDDVLDGVGNVITATTTFNSAYLIGWGDPGRCTDSHAYLMQIEVNALRAGGKTVQAGPNQTRDVTAKARILKGTAQPGTTIDMQLTIEAIDGTDVISTNSTGPIRLGVGKGGNGAKLALDIPRCNSGFIEFVAKFFGTDVDGDPCEGARTLRKACR